MIPLSPVLGGEGRVRGQSRSDAAEVAAWAAVAQALLNLDETITRE